MKKKQHDGDVLKYLRKMMRIMRLSLFLIIISTAMAFSANSYSQNTKLSLELNNVTVKEAIKAIEDQSEFIFFYQEKHVDFNRRITLHSTNQDVKTILDQVFEGTENIYVINDRQIVIGKAPRKELEKQMQSIKGNVKPVIDQPQQKEITGKVTDTDGLPLPGVSVVVKGTTTGTVTNNDGEFFLDISEEADSLQFSFVGMRTQEVAIEDRTTFTVVIEEETVGIEEVVAVGYGTIRKSDLTGSVAKVISEELEKGSGASFDQQMAGKLAGVHITQQSGAPGSGSIINIRGFNSLGGSQPLIVVDGYPIDMGNYENPSGNMWDSDVQQMNPLAALNPSDIESIEVLKDASSTAIYGSRGANGVIMITTKMGKRGTNRINYDYKFSMDQVGKTYDVLDTRQYMEYVNEANELAGELPKYEPEKLDSLVEANPNTNWQDVIYRTAQTHNHNLSFTGADDVNRYNVSLNYLTQEGVIINSNFERITARLNASRKINKNFEVGTRSNFNYTQSKAAAHSFANGDPGGSVVLGGIFFRPLDKPYDPEQESDDVVNGNPVVVANNKLDDSRIQTFYTSLYANWEIIDGLTFGFNGGVNSVISQRNQYQPRLTYFGDLNNGFASRALNTRINYLSEFTLTYNKEFAKIHRINAVAGFTWQEWFNERQYIAVSNFINDNLGYQKLDAGGSPDLPVSTKISWALASYLGRVNYTLMDKYLFTFTARYDGSTRLGEGNKWDFFPSFALGWNIHKESFMDAVQPLSNLKARVSYGLSGNQSIAPNSLIALYFPQQYPVNQVGETGLVTLPSLWARPRLANSELGWESTTQFDVGFDLGILDNRYTLAFDYYKKETENLLIDLEVPPSTGYGSYPSNAGLIENKGWELELGAKLLSGAFTWNLSGNISHNENKLVELGELEEVLGGTYLSAGNISSNEPIHISRVGEPLGQFFGYEITGIFQNQAEIDAAPAVYGNAQPGDFIYKDQITVDTDGDGVDDAGDGLINASDRTIIGSPYPDFIYGISNSFAYKGFTLDVFIQGSQGNEVFNLNLYALSDPNTSTNWNILKETYENAWRGEGTTNEYQRPKASAGVVHNGHMSNRFVEDGSYIRLKTVTLSYDLHSSKIKFLNGFRIYVGGNNLYTITNYSGYDPEVSGLGSTAMTQAVDWGTYPMPRTFFAGVNVKF